MLWPVYRVIILSQLLIYILRPRSSTNISISFPTIGELEAQIETTRGAVRRYESEGKEKFNQILNSNKKLEQAGVLKNTKTNLR